MELTEICVVQHSYDREGCEEIKFIGAYTSEDAAQEAISRARHQVGFLDHPTDFHISRYELGKDHWTEGFVTL